MLIRSSTLRLMGIAVGLVGGTFVFSATGPMFIHDGRLDRAIYEHQTNPSPVTEAVLEREGNRVARVRRRIQVGIGSVGGALVIMGAICLLASRRGLSDGDG